MVFSEIYNDPVSEKGQATMEWFAADGSEDLWSFGQPVARDAILLMKESLAQDDATAIHEEFNRLFVGPYKLPAPPWASVYTDPEGVIFGNATLGVRPWMRDTLVRISLGNHEPEHQLGLAVSMLSWAISHDVSDEGIRCFLEQHLLSWAPFFLNLFEQGAQNAWYVGVARLAAVTLADWQDRFQLEIPQINLRARD